MILLNNDYFLFGWILGVIIWIYLAYTYEAEDYFRKRSECGYVKYKKVTRGNLVIFFVVCVIPLMALIATIVAILMFEIQVIPNWLRTWWNKPLVKDDK